MRLIDADALPVCKEHCIDECGFGANFYVVHKTDIDAAPTITIEAEPVKHGRWDEWWPEIHLIMTGEEMLYCCSNCTAKYADIENKRYCPNCGCKMDLEETK